MTLEEANYVTRYFKEVCKLNQYLKPPVFIYFCLCDKIVKSNLQEKGFIWTTIQGYSLTLQESHKGRRLKRWSCYILSPARRAMS